MGIPSLGIFDKTLQESDRWLRIVMEELETDSRRLAFSALRATLHALRDWIGPANAVHLGAQLPMLLRGAYYEGWQSTAVSVHEGDIEVFLNHIALKLRRNADLNPQEAAKATFVVLSECVEPHAIKRLLKVTRLDMRLLWPGIIPPAQSLQAH